MWKFQFSWKDYGFTSCSCIGYAVCPILGADTPYNAECGVSVIYLQRGSSTTSVRINESGSTLLLLLCFPRSLGRAYIFFELMLKWTRQTVGNKLRKTKNLESFLSLEKGYLPIRIEKTDIIIFRESNSVSYFFCYPVNSVEASNVNEFMVVASQLLTELLEQKEQDNLCYNPAQKVLL